MEEAANIILQVPRREPTAIILLNGRGIKPAPNNTLVRLWGFCREASCCSQMAISTDPPDGAVERKILQNSQPSWAAYSAPFLPRLGMIAEEGTERL